MTTFDNARFGVDVAVREAARYARETQVAEADVLRLVAAARHQHDFSAAAARRVVVANEIEPALLESSRSWVHAVGENAAWVRDDAARARDLTIDATHDAVERAVDCAQHVDRLLRAVTNGFLAWTGDGDRLVESTAEQRGWFYDQLQQAVSASQAAHAALAAVRAAAGTLPPRGDTPVAREWKPTPEFEEMIARASEMAYKA